MSKEKLNILVIDRHLTDEEKPVLLFKKYQIEGYDVIIFPFREDKRITEVIFFSYYKCLRSFEELFQTIIEQDLDDVDTFYDFDLEEIDEDAFYDVLSQKFEVISSKLTEIEKVRV
jgi:hypothetical protein